MNRPLKLLSKEDMQKVHDASLEILEKTGMRIDHHKAREALGEAGANVNNETKTVNFPPELVEKYLKNHSREVTYGGIDPNYTFTLKAGVTPTTRATAMGTSYVDLNTGEYRNAKLADLREWAILVDALKNIHIAEGFFASDVPAQTSDIYSAKMMFENQRKPTIVPALGAKNLKYMIEMALAIVGSRDELKKRPILSGVVATVSPLFMTEDDVEQLFLCGQYGIPSANCTMTNMGSSGPISPAGSLAVANAEQLAVLTLSEILFPGYKSPFVWLPMSTDMFRGIAMFTTPDVTLANIAFSQLASEFYNMPIETAGLMSDGLITEQALFQKAFNGITAILAGTTAISGLGSVDFSLGASPVQLVIDDEIMEMLLVISKGFEVNDDTLALDVINQIGPQGNFLGAEHTLKYLKSSKPFNPTLFDCEYGQKWLSKGAKNLERKAREKALAILEKHEVPPLPEDVRREIGLILGKANEELVK